MVAATSYDLKVCIGHPLSVCGADPSCDFLTMYASLLEEQVSFAWHNVTLTYECEPSPLIKQTKPTLNKSMNAILEAILGTNKWGRGQGGGLWALDIDKKSDNKFTLLGDFRELPAHINQWCIGLYMLH